MKKKEINITTNEDGRTVSFKFFLEDEEIQDVYLSSKITTVGGLIGTTGMADFVPLDCVPENVKKAVKILLEEEV